MCPRDEKEQFMKFRENSGYCRSITLVVGNSSLSANDPKVEALKATHNLHLF